MKKLNFLFLLFVAMIGCKIGDEAGPSSTFYSSEINLRVSNPKSSYAVGDTLWLNASIPVKTLTDATTSKVFDVKNSVFHLTFTPIGFLFVDSTDLLIHERIDFVSNNPMVRPDDNYPAMAQFEMGCPDEDFNLKIGVVFKDKGHFLFWLNRSLSNSIDDPYNYGVSTVPQNGSCDNFDINDDLIYTYTSFKYDVYDSNQSAYEAFFEEVANDPSNLTPEAEIEAARQDIKKMFERKWSYFVVVE
jgi:hypothetical protein